MGRVSENEIRLHLIQHLLIVRIARRITIPRSCPELNHLGLTRGLLPEMDLTIEEDDTRIGGLMSEETGLAACRSMAGGVVFQVNEYLMHGFKILGSIGINTSPTCGVERHWAEGGYRDGPGVFTRILIEELNNKGISVKMRGVNAKKPEKAVKTVEALLNG